MDKNLVGYRFSPTGEELINHYLNNKILDKPWLVDDAISEINIYSYKPEFLPSLSKLETNDLVWYFFCRRESYATEKKKKGTKRTTPSGFWKATGKDRIIKDRRRNGAEIGIKKTLVYHHGKAANGVGTPWVMHEYHTTSLPLDKRNYVICQVMYKGAEGDIVYSNNFNDLSHSTMMVSDLNTVIETNTAPEVEQPREEDLYMSVDDLANPLTEQDDTSLFNPDTLFNDNYCPYPQPQAPWDDEYISGLLTYNGGNFNDVCPEINLLEHRNDHKPKEPVTGIFVDCSSDSDAESISATSYQRTSSPDSAHSLSGHFHTSVDEIPSLRKDSCKDIQLHAETSINRKIRKSHFTRRTTPSKQEVKEGKSKAVDASMDKKKASSCMVKTEKKGWFVIEEAMDRRNRKHPQYIYLMNMIIGFILLVAVIGNIIT